MNSEQQLPLSDIKCQFPLATALTAHYYGCRCRRCREAKTVSQQKYRAKYPTQTKTKAKEYSLKTKLEAFNAYGGCKCNCCGEVTLEFLSLDHVLNDGFKDHNKNKTRCAGNALYSRLRKQGYPDKHRYQVLCMNCNFGKKFTGTCPHTKAY